jgi:integrase
MARRTTGIRERHSRGCGTRRGGRCNCHPSYEASCWSPRDGRKIRKSFPTISAAKAWRADADHAKRRGQLRAPTTLTLAAAAEQWLEAAKRGEILNRNRLPYKPSTLRGYEADLRRYVLPDLGAHRLAAIRADDLQALIDRLVGFGLSGSKVRNVLVPVQALYRRHRRVVATDPTDGLDLPAPGGRRERAVAPAQAAELIERLPSDLQALYATACYAGLRRGELRALRVSDINFPAATEIRVVRSWDDVVGPVLPKSVKGQRVVPVAGELRRFLLAEKLRSGRDGEDLLFGRSAREPFTSTWVRKRALAAWATAAVGAFLRGEPGEIEPIGLHEARHSYVSLMHAAGCSLEEIGDFVGHSSAYMVDRYRHLLDGQRERAAQRLDAFLTGAQTGAQRPEVAQLSGRD